MLGPVVASLNVVTEWLDSHATDDYKRQPMALDLSHIAEIQCAAADAHNAYVLMSSLEPGGQPEGDDRDVIRALAVTWCRATIAMLHFCSSPEMTGQYITEAVREINRRMVTSVHAERMSSLTAGLL